MKENQNKYDSFNEIHSNLFNQVYQDYPNHFVDFEENNIKTKKIYKQNPLLKQKYLEANEINKKNNTTKKFQIVHVFKKKVKRMYRIDCMTRKIIT